MLFGSELDDDLFEKVRERKEEIPLSYNVKICQDRWFQLNSKDFDSDQLITCLKHEADYCYSKNLYQQAASIYQQCLDKMPHSNTAGKRDCIEGLARSLLHQGQAMQAVEWALKLHEGSCNADHHTVSWSLLAVIYHELKMYQEELAALQNCVQIHPWNADFWLRLAYCYAGYFGVHLCCNCKLPPKSTLESKNGIKCREQNDQSCSQHVEIAMKDDQNLSPQNHPIVVQNRDSYESTVYLNTSNCLLDSVEDNNQSSELHCSRDNWCCAQMKSVENIERRGVFYVCACLLRARLLLQGCCSGHRSFGQMKNKAQQNKISQHIDCLKIGENFKNLAVHMLSRDIAIEFQDTSKDNEVMTSEKDEAEKKSGSSELLNSLFEAQWLSWIQDYCENS